MALQPDTQNLAEQHRETSFTAICITRPVFAKVTCALAAAMH